MASLDWLPEFLSRLNTPVLVFEPAGEGLWQVSYWNRAMESLREDGCDVLAGKGPKEIFEAAPKSNSSFAQGLPTKPHTALVPHTAMFQTTDNEQTRVKVKYDWADDKTLLAWVEPFSEDMALTQAHSDFVSVVSHEFRTPLTSIKGFADTLIRYGGSLEIEQQKRFISIIKHQADRLTRLVENLLLVSKLGAQRTQFAFRPINIKRTVERIIQSVEGKLAEPRQFVVQIPEDVPDIWADPDKLEQVMLNLIDNAAKYSYPNTEVRVTAKALDESGDRVQVDIKDQGVGIPAEHLPNIFNKFSRIDNPLTREVEGTGLGLYITKSLTKAMGGDISVASEHNVGTTFSVVLPAATPERQAQSASLSSSEEDVDD